MKIIRDITLDLSRHGVQCTIPVTQHDVGTLRLVIHLRNGSVPVTLEEGDRANLFLDTDLFDPVTVYTENGAYPNCLVYDVSARATSAVGTRTACFQIYKNSAHLQYSPEFAFAVCKDMTNGSAVLSSPQYASVLLAEERASQYAKKAEEYSENAEHIVQNHGGLFIRYSAYADGTDFTETWSEGQDYIGYATTWRAPTDKSEYTWALMKGYTIEIVNTIGNSTSKVMSQKAVADAIDPILSAFETEGGYNLLDPNNVESGLYETDGESITAVANDWCTRTRNFIQIPSGVKTIYLSTNKDTIDENLATRSISLFVADANANHLYTYYRSFSDLRSVELPSGATQMHLSMNGANFGVTCANICLSVVDAEYEEYGTPKTPTALKSTFLPSFVAEELGSAITVRTEVGKNLFDRNSCMIDAMLDSNAVGYPQKTYSESGWRTQRIEISDANSYALLGVRVFSITDENDCVLTQTTWIPAETAYVLSSDDIPQNAKYLWVAVPYLYMTDWTQVEVGTESTPYEPYKSKYIFSSNGKNIDLSGLCPIDEQEASDLGYNSDLLLRENEQLKRDLDFMSQRQAGLYELKSGATVDSQVVTLKNTNEKKLILHIHRYANNGFDTTNDVFLPNAKKNFGDLRITDNRGNVLPYFINKISELDVVEDSRIHIVGDNMMRKDSKGNIISVKSYGIVSSTDNGETWEKIEGLDGIRSLVAVNPDDSLLVGSTETGMLYKSYPPYTSREMVLDCSNYTGVYFGPDDTKMLNDGSLLLGAYQLERSIRIYKSTDNGSTWRIVYEDNSGKYQHCHNIYVDNAQEVETIYIGVDGGGGVLKSTDGGETWTDLRDVSPSMPQATDYGVIYSEEGFRLLGGETAIVGGHSIIRTEDDINFTPVLSVGHHVFVAKKLGDYIIAGLCGTNSHRAHGLVVSKDKGFTWDKIYTTSPCTDTEGASDGFRRMSDTIFENTIVAQCQSASRKTVRITKHDEPVYAEIIVDVPENTTSLTVENGYAIGNTTLMHNAYEPANKKLLHYPLNEGSDFVKETVSGNIYKGDFEFVKCGKNFGSEFDKQSALLSSLKGFANHITLPNSFTLSFWDSRPEETADKFNLICKGSNKLTIEAHKLLFNGTHIIPALYPFIGGTQRVDIVFDGENKTIKSYINGRQWYSQYSSVDVDSVINAFAGEGDVVVLQNLKCDCERGIQHFTIYDGVLSEYDMLNSVHFELSDNHQTA